MEKHDEKKKKLLVAGGGFTGVAAAICAAKNGMEVILVEQSNSLGGAAMINLVNPFMPYWTYTPEREKDYLSAGFFKELVDRMKDFGILAENEKTFAEEPLKLLLNRMILEAGVKLLFNCSVVQSNVAEGRIKSVTAHGCGSNFDLEADYFVDATGDGNLFALSGVPYELGRKGDGFCQPMTLCFRLGNIDPTLDQADVKRKINQAYQEYVAAGKMTNPRENVLIFPTMTDSVLHFNTTRVIKLNPLDSWEVTRAEIMAREQIQELVEMIQKVIPELKDCVLLSSAVKIGIRESRRMYGLHLLTEEEIKACTVFEDSIAVGNYDIDIHNPAGTGTSHYYFPAGEYYTIPYRSLVPANGPDNLIVAGRCVSATHEAQASIRIMPICACMGHAAGAAAAVASKEECSFADATVTKIQELLQAEGARIF